MLPEILNTLELENTGSIDVLMERGRHLIRTTPRTTIDLLRNLHSHRELPLDSAIFTKVMSMKILALTADEILENEFDQKLNVVQEAESPEQSPNGMREGAEPRHIFKEKYLMIDCRSRLEYTSGHLPQSMHIDPQAVILSVGFCSLDRLKVSLT